MQIVELQGGEHLVDDRMLMNKFRQLIHNSGNQGSTVPEANIDVGARNHSVMLVHAHVKSDQGAGLADLMDPMSVVGLFSSLDHHFILVDMHIGDFIQMNLLGVSGFVENVVLMNSVHLQVVVDLGDFLDVCGQWLKVILIGFLSLNSLQAGQ